MPVAFDSISAPSSSYSGSYSTYNFTWSHTASGSDRALVVFIGRGHNSGQFLWWDGSTVTYGGVAMTRLVTTQSNTLGAIYGLLNPTSGTANISVNVKTTGSAENVSVMDCVAASYTGVSSFGATGGSESATSFTISADTSGKLVCGGFVGISMSAFNFTQRSSARTSTIFGDVAGNSTTSQTLTASANTYYCGAGVVLVPKLSQNFLALF